MRQHHLPVQCMYLVKKDLRHFGHGQFRWRFNQKIYIKQDSFTLEKVIELCASICGVEMCGWVNSDDPWCEHAKWVPKCPYLLQEKGEGFVENVLRNWKTPKASKDLKYVKALAERKKMYEIENAILSTSRSANGSAADSQVDVSKGAVKKTVYCVGSKDDGSKGSKANALKGSLSESASPDNCNDTGTLKRVLKAEWKIKLLIS